MNKKGWQKQCHWKDTSFCVFHFEIVIGKFFAINWITTSPVTDSRYLCWNLRSKVTSQLDTMTFHWPHGDLTWHMKPGMIRWKTLPLYPNPFDPVASVRKFFAVFGTASSKSTNSIRPIFSPSIDISKKTFWLNNSYDESSLMILALGKIVGVTCQPINQKTKNERPSSLPGIRGLWCLPSHILKLFQIFWKQINNQSDLF